MKFRLYGPTLLMLAACSHVNIGWSAPLRVIVSFGSAVPLDDAQLLTRLSTAANGRVEFAAAVSPNAAAYVLYCPSEDSSCALAIARLRNFTGVTDIAVDRKETMQ